MRVKIGNEGFIFQDSTNQKALPGGSFGLTSSNPDLVAANLGSANQMHQLPAQGCNQGMQISRAVSDSCLDVVVATWFHPFFPFFFLLFCFWPNTAGKLAIQNQESQRELSCSGLSCSLSEQCSRLPDAQSNLAVTLALNSFFVALIFQNLFLRLP